MANHHPWLKAAIAGAVCYGAIAFATLQKSYTFGYWAEQRELLLVLGLVFCGISIPLTVWMERRSRSQWGWRVTLLVTAISVLVLAALWRVLATSVQG